MNGDGWQVTVGSKLQWMVSDDSVRQWLRLVEGLSSSLAMMMII